MAKTLCEWKKNDIKKNWKGYVKLVKKAEYVCEKCGRSAADKNSLCKPAKM